MFVKQDSKPQQWEQPSGDESRGRQGKAARSGVEGGNASVHRLAADSTRSSQEGGGRRRPTPKGIPPSPGRSEEEFQARACFPSMCIISQQRS